MVNYSPFPPFDDQSGNAASEGAAAAIRSYCRWHIWPQVTETLVLDGPGTPLLLLPTLALTAVTAVTETQWGRGVVPVVLVPATDVDWSAAGMLWRVDRRCWSSKPRGITVTYTHGYAAVPDAVARVATALARRAAGNPSALTRVQVGQRSEEYSVASGMLPDEMASLDAYSRRFA